MTKPEDTTLQETLIQESKRNLWERLTDWIFGYDFFISYRWDDAGVYAAELASRLRELKFDCFLDTADFRPGGNWRLLGRQALRNTSKLILVASNAAANDPRERIGRIDPIVDEITSFDTTRRQKVRIILPSLDTEIWSKSPLAEHFHQDDLTLTETCNTPSQTILDELRRWSRLERRQRRRIRLLIIFSVVLALLALLAAAAFGVAEARKKNLQKTLSSSDFHQAEAYLEHGESRLAITHLARSVKSDPKNHAALVRLSNLLAARAWPVPINSGTQSYSSINRISISTCNNWFAAASSDGTARLWDLKTGLPQSQPLQHEEKEWAGADVRDVAFSPDGSVLVSAGIEGVAKLWRVPNGDLLAELRGHADSINRAAFHPAGDYIATASDDGSIRLWNLDGTQHSEPLNHPNKVSDIIFINAGEAILTACDDGNVRIWSDMSSPEPSSIYNNNARILQLAASPDGRHFAAGGIDGTVRIWGTTDGEIKATLKHGDHVPSLHFSPNGEQLLCGSGYYHSWEATVWDWRQETQLLKVVHPIVDPGGEVGAGGYGIARWSADGGKFLTGFSGDRYVRIWSAESGQEIIEPIVHADPIQTAQFVNIPDKRETVVIAACTSARLWASRDPYIGEPKQIAGPPAGIHAYCAAAKYLPMRNLLAWSLSSNNGSGNQWAVLDVSAEGAVRYFGGPGPVGLIEASPNESMIVTGDYEGNLQLWRLPEFSLAGPAFSHGSEVTGAVFTKDGRRLFTSGIDGIVRAWSVFGDPHEEFHRNFGRAVTCIDLDPCRDLIAVGTEDGRVETVKIRTLAQRSAVEAHSLPVSALSGLGSKGVIASLGVDGRMCFIELNSGGKISSSLSLPGTPTDISFFRRSDSFVITGTFPYLIVGDIASRTLMHRPIDIGARGRILSSSEDFDIVLLSIGDKKLQLFDLHYGRAIIDPIVFADEIQLGVLSDDGTSVLAVTRSAEVFRVPIAVSAANARDGSALVDLADLLSAFSFNPAGAAEHFDPAQAHHNRALHESIWHRRKISSSIPELRSHLFLDMFSDSD